MERFAILMNGEALHGMKPAHLRKAGRALIAVPAHAPVQDTGLAHVRSTCGIAPLQEPVTLLLKAQPVRGNRNGFERVIRLAARG